MFTKRLFDTLGNNRFFVCIFTLLIILGTNCLFAVEKSVSKGHTSPAHSIFTLKNIPAKKGLEYLSILKIGTASQLPASNALLVTAQPQNLQKAGALIGLVDSNEPFVIKPVLTASKTLTLPSIEQLTAELADMSIGTFAKPPKSPAKPKAIVDLHQGSVIVVAPAGRFEKIISVVRKLQKTPSGASIPTTKEDVPAKPRQPVDRARQIELKTTPEPATPKPTTEKMEVEILEKLAAPKETPQIKAGKVNQKSDELLNKRRNSVTDTENKSPEPVEQTKSVLESQVSVKEKQPLDLNKSTEKLNPPPEPQPPSITARSYQPEPVIDGNETLDLELPEKLPIIDLLALVGEYLQLDYMYDPAKVTGDVAFKLQGKLSGKIKIKDLYPLLESIMQFKGFVMSRKGNLVIIVPVADALQIDPTLLVDEEGKVEAGDVIVTRVFELKHIDVVDAKNLLDGMKLGLNINTSITGAKTVIVTAYAYRMKRIENLLQIIDKPGKPKQFRFRQLKYTMAVNLVPKVQALADQLGTVSISVGAAAVTPTKQVPARRARRPTPKKPTPKPAPGKAEKPTVYLDADERTNRVLMIGLAEQLDEVTRLIEALDVEKQDLRSLQLYEILYVGAEDVREKLVEIGIITGTTRTTTSRAALSPRKSATKAQTPPTSAKEPLSEEPQLIIIETTNSLLVNATVQQHTQIATIISYVDTEAEVDTIPYKIYPLENQDPVALAETLNQLISETVESKPQDKTKKLATATTATSTRSKFEENITILADEGTFSLIVYASKKNQIWIESLINQLDRRRPQVLLDVTLVQITKDDAFTFAVDALAAVPDAEFISGQLPLNPDKSPQFIFDTIAGASDRGKFLEFKSFSSEDSGDYKGFYGNEKISALITAVQEQGYGRVMARPKLLVNDNEEGEIKTTRTTYITRKSTSYISTGGTGGSTGGIISQPVEAVNFDDYSAGLTLTIKPHISAGDMLRLEITLNRSDFEGELEGLEKPPNKTDEDVKTVVTVPNNSTIILGGVESIRSARGGKKVPLLGDIPLIGGLFRNVARSDRQNKLYIFVKAYILRPGGEFALDDLRKVSQKNRRNFEELEDEMSRYETWPGTKPTPLDPLRVLEVD